MDSTMEKGLRVLEMIVAAPGPVRLSTVAQELGLQKSNAHRSIATLVSLGYVTQDEASGLYRPSLKLFELGARVAGVHPVRRATAPYLQDLHRTLGETVNFYVLEHNSVLVVDKLLSPRPLRFSSQPGSRLPIATTAAGNAMLAHAPDPEALLQMSLKAIPPRADTPLDPAKVLKGLANIRKNGFAEATNSWTPGIFSIAVPLKDPDGHATAALGVSGPIERQTPDNRAAIIEALMTTSARIAENFALA
ncbi:IclR family transcriptional regulator [Henriciella sp. AS95]|uniref:IclR family transcriptional regulator n=1 Tax=Henriciella sp. AS95 TaxID=3135782 RepID=UPI00316E5CCD